ncbi:MAG: hypothetical protein J6V44_12540 [Methanobrevibacter sp.]|jgi:hypothetical protein|nr:hypothetical protein [Methanobrevibacter sp.]
MDTRFLHNSKYLYSDNKTIFKTTTGYERYDYSVYVFCDPNEPFNLKVGDVVIPHRPFYIGKGLAFGPVNR